MRYHFKAVDQCNMCGSADFRFLGMRLSTSQGLNPRKAEGIAVPVKQCRRCGLIFSDPQPVPESLSDHYGLPPEEYWGKEALSWTPDYFSRQIDAAKQLISFVPGMRALDIGVGLGKAMKSLSLAGFDTWGVEPSETFRSKAIELMGLDPERIQLGTMEVAEYPPDSFDFITFGAVLEHLYDPRLALERALVWLKRGGVIQAEVPSSDHLIPKLVNTFFRLRGTNYVTHISPMHSPFHLYEFALKSFRDFSVARYWYDVCYIYHVPRLLHGPLRWWMERTNTGMQLTVYLKRG
jgi:SAM-dependent methyltransferase